MDIQIQKNGEWQSVTEQELRAMAKTGEIHAETSILRDGQPATASSVEGIEFSETQRPEWRKRIDAFHTAALTWAGLIAKFVYQGAEKAVPVLHGLIERLPGDASKKTAFAEKYISAKTILIVAICLLLLPLVSSFFGENNATPSIELAHTTLADTSALEGNDENDIPKSNNSFPTKKIADKKPPSTSGNDAIQENSASNPQDSLENYILKKIIGEESDHYKQYGYKDIALRRKRDRATEKLRTSDGIEVVLSDNNLKTREFLPGEILIYDSNDELICYTIRYSGTFEEYKDSILETFGKTKQEITESGFRGMLRDCGVLNVKNSLNLYYTFEKVCVKVVICDKKEILPGRDGEPVVRKLPYIQISVIDRAWYEKQLRHRIRTCIETINWAFSLSRIVDSTPVPLLADFPPYPRTEIIPTLKDSVRAWHKLCYRHEWYDFCSIHYYDPENKKHDTMLFKSGMKRNCSSSIDVYFDLCPNMKNIQLLGQKILCPIIGTPFARRSFEINSIILQIYFEPKTEKITVEKSDDDEYYEWETADDWHIRLSASGLVEMSKNDTRKVEGKKL